jgi:hypothetical protein
MDIRSAEINGAPQETIEIHRAPITSARGAVPLSANGGNRSRRPQPIPAAARSSFDRSRTLSMPMPKLLIALLIVLILALLGLEAAALSSGALVLGLTR